MLARAETHGLQLVFEVVLWALPALLAAVLLVRGRPHARAGWLVVALACAVISVDKGIDLQMRAMPWLRDLAHFIDPEAANTGRHRGVRVAIVGGAAALSMAGLWLVLRRDQQLDGPKRLSACGLCGVVCYLGARFLVPPGSIRDVVGWTVELMCWTAVTLGGVWGLRRRHAGPG